MRLIILEGPDGSGKTTLARELRLKCGYAAAIEKATAPAPDEDAFDRFLTTIKTHVLTGTQTLIFDRAHIGEQVYGPIYRAGDSLGVTKRRMLERVMMAYRAVIVLCRPTFDRSADEHATRWARGEEMFSPAQFGEVYRAFAPGRFETDLPMLLYDYANDQGGIVGRIQHIVRMHYTDFHEPDGQLLRPEIGAGMWRRHGVLLVGDQATQSSPYLSSWPFVSSKGSSPWLTERLERARIPENRLSWVNANNVDNKALQHRILRLDPRRVVALGHGAANTLRRLDIGHIRLNHPAYEKRFHSNLAELYELQLRDAIWKGLAPC